MNDNDYNVYGQLSADQKRYVDYLREDYGFSVTDAVAELEHHDWDYGQTDRAIKCSRPDI